MRKNVLPKKFYKKRHHALQNIATLLIDAKIKSTDYNYHGLAQIIDTAIMATKDEVFLSSLGETVHRKAAET